MHRGHINRKRDQTKPVRCSEKGKLIFFLKDVKHYHLCNCWIYLHYRLKKSGRNNFYSERMHYIDQKTYVVNKCLFVFYLSFNVYSYFSFQNRYL